MLNKTCCLDLPIPQALYQPGMVLLPRWTTVCQRIHLISPPQEFTIQQPKIFDRPRSQNDTSGRQFGPQVKPSSEVSTTAGTLPNKGSEVSKPLRTQLGHFQIMVWKCSVDTSEVLFGGVHRTLPNCYSAVSYTTISPFNPVSCRFNWFSSSFSCTQMILHIYLITVCTYFEECRPRREINPKKCTKHTNLLLFFIYKMAAWPRLVDCLNNPGDRTTRTLPNKGSEVSRTSSSSWKLYL